MLQGGCQLSCRDENVASSALSLGAVQVVRLRTQFATVVARLADTEKLLAIADPDGFFKAGSAAAKAATLRAKQALAAERLRAEAAEKRRKIREVRD